MDLNKMLNPEEPSQAQSPQLLQPGQASDNNGSHNLPGIHSLSLLGAFHHEGSSLPTSTGDASTQGATSVKGAQNESSALSSTNQDLNASSILSSMHRPARPETAFTPHTSNLVLHTSDSLQNLNEGVNEALFRRDSAVSRRSSDNSAMLRFPPMPILNSDAPDGVHRQSVYSDWSSIDAGDTQISPVSTVPSLIPDAESHGADEGHRDEGHRTDMALGSPLDTHQNAFTAVNITSWARPTTNGHDHNELLPLARTGKEPEDCQVLLTDEQMRNMEHEAPDDGTPGPRCAYMLEPDKICNLPDRQGRKVISQIFGRNKTSTRALGDDLYITWCRKHYQRARYRQGNLKNYGTVQCNLLIGVLERMINSQAVTSFTITLRLREHERRYWAGENIPDFIKKRTFQKKKVVARDPNKRAAPQIQNIPVPDYMLSFCGEDKSFDDVKAMIALLRENNTMENPNVGDGPQICIDSWPDIELLPNINPSWNPAAADDDDGDDNNDDDDTMDGEGEDPDEGSSAGKKRKRASEKTSSPSAKKSKTTSSSTKSARGGKGKSKASATPTKSTTPLKSTRGGKGKSKAVATSRDEADTSAAEILASLSKSPTTPTAAALAA